MALESTSPFQGPTNSSGRLFADDNHVEPFNFAFPASATPVFNLSSHANTVLNVSHSTPVLGAKFDVNSSIKTFEEKFDIDSISSDDRKSGESASDISKCDSHDASGGVNSTVSRDNEKCIKFRAGNANVHDEESSDNEDLVECGNCDAEFQNLQDYMDHTCAGNKSVQSGTGDRDDETAAVHKDLSDVESFDGKIVYNPDGSAYIIEGDSDSELEMIIDFPKKEGAIVDKKGKDNNSCHENEIPHIDNAFFVPRNPNSFLSNPFMLHYKPHATPIMHSYRVYDLRSGTHSKSWKSDMSLDTSQTSRSSPSDSTSAATSTAFKSLTSSLSAPSVPTKPILMCFICKLSFGFVKSFMSHATTEHGMELSNEEKDIMSQKNSSAIIQGIGKDKEPLMSFLEPIKSSNSETETKVNCNAKISEKSNLAMETTSVSYVYTKPKISDMCEHSVRSQQEQKQGKDLSIHDIRNQLAGSKHEIDSPQGLIANPQTKQSDPNDQYKHQKSDYNDSEDSNSQSSFPMTPAQKYMQDMDISSESPKSFLPPFSPSQRNYFGVCEDHPNGRAPGAECPSCDMILSSSQSLGGHMTMMHSRNSCKTLKCPKCNWHYKYQETLEIHMKEKHPEGDQKCMYCLTNQTHPRLARGESYSCGYKPYRCEVCNYSTTTKGNLSIHMQSDKHLNNVQDLANSGTDMAQFTKHSAMVGPHQLQSHPNPSRSHTPTLPPPSPTATKSAPPHQQLLQQYQSHQHQQQSSQQQQDMKKGKPKPTWRCDVCNYETNVARNLRIHMTSEKHTHNMMVLQQNMKHMQRDMQLHQMNQLVMLQQDPSFLGLTGPIPGGITFPYEGSMMMGGLPTGFPEAPVDLSKENGHHTVGPSGPNGPTDLTEVNRLFQCSVCNVFGTDSLESLHQHLQMDRTKAHEGENITVANGTYMCSLCQYKTTLKANFQLHCKTDKHIQRLQLVNHIKEGGATNEWRLKYLNVSNPIQVRCNCCDYYTNSIHKLQIHTGNPRHEASAQLFCHLQQQEIRVTKKEKYYHCSLCKFNARTKLGLMQHVHSVQHLHSEGLKQLEMKETGQLEVDIGDIFQVKVAMDIDSMKFDDDANTPSSNGLADEDSNFTESDHADAKDRVFTPASPSQSINNNNNTIKQSINALLAKGDVRSENDSEMPIKSHLLTSANTLLTPAHHQVNNKPSAESLPCPLYQKPFSDKSKVHNHVGSDHHVKGEGFRKSLLALADDSHDMKTKMAPMTFADVSRLPQATMKLVASMEVDNNMVEAHWEKLAHEDAIDITAMSEKDVDDHFRCQTCSKSFVNIDQLYSHQNELGHLELKQTPRGPGYLCWKKGCNQYFKTAQALQMHFREIHAKVSGLSSAAKAEYKYHCSLCTLGFKSEHKLKYHAQLHLIKSAITCNLCAKTYSSIELLRKHVETSHDLSESAREQYQAEIDANTLSFSTFLMDPKLAKVFILPETFNQKSGNEAVLLENGIADSDKSSKDVSPCTTPASDENGFDQESMDESKEFMEDYMNSMAFAENSYEDPNRKFKCHRCKVAFTKQLYLSAHNKTIVHKKGEKFNYPIEKFMDPNRPYKCDVCMESFTQKNILLVHCNSVSHLHKMKQHTSLADFPLALTPTSSGPVPSTATAYSSAADTLHTFAATSTSATSSSEKHSSMKSREASPAEDDSIKPYKCNICKVSYSQGSTLDIHIRSVGHQTRASKLHELAMSGEIDLTRPLIEEPIDKSFQAQQQKMLNDFLTKQTSLSQQSMLFQGLPGLTSFPGFHGLPSLPGLPLLPGLPPLLPISIPSHMFPQSMALSSLSSQSQSGNSKAKLSSVVESTASTKSLEKISSHSQHRDSVKMFSGHVSQAGGSTSTTQLSGSLQVCHRCSAVFNSAESFALHQAACSINSSSPGLSPSSGNKARFTGRIKTAVQRNLLENFGFECVMQFNEFNQRRMKKEEESVKKDDTNEKENMPDNNSNNLSELENGEVKEPNEGDDVSQNVKIEKQVHLPEMNKSKCNKCSKQFSSVWVLKAHEEEVHKEIVPLEIVEEVGDKFKSDFEKKIPKDLPAPELPPTPAPITPIPEEKHVKQEMPPPPPPPPNAAQMQMDMFQMMFGMGMLPMSMPLMMNMNTQASMMPMMMPPPGLDMQSPTLPNLPMGPGSAQSRQIDANQKRARTRINDEQLKVLRGYFDINNSPSEEQIQAMSEQTGLPMKVIKHWFRNTLFKERQRNKDSPYNFSNPPSTTLDLEEYEKTGKLTIIEDSSLPPSKSPSPAVMKTESEIKKKKPEPMEESKSSKPMEKPSETPKILPSVIEPSIVESVKKETEQRKSNEETAKVTVTTPSSALTPPPSSDIKFSNPTPIIQQSIMSTPNAGSSFMQSFTSSFSGMSTPSYPPASTTPNSCIYDGNYSPPGGSSAGRRANRTRFTDYQVKCLQEYFDQNAYPKDDELEHLSKMLGLSPRVIVVWFQNARQKARKVYENQPAENSKEVSATSPYSRTSGLTYQCKKCQSVFQRYYDLIRHQKRSCFTDAEKQDSHMLSDDSDSMSNVTSLDNTAFSDSESECSNMGRSKELNSSSNSDGSKKFHCEKCDVSFSQYDQYREHQSFHNMYMNSAFGMLQNMAANSSNMHGMSDQSPIKRKYEDDQDDDHDQPKDKRLRTTILPEQLDYLYQKYQIDCNPSRKQLEAISKDVGLKKRVVQVWFQNTRARERKGQYRAHQQLIHKRCPICRALFRAKSALESHLATKHPEEMAKGDINIDAIPDAAIESPVPSSSGMVPPSPDYSKLLAPPAMQGLLPYMPPVSLGGLAFPPMPDPIQMSMKQFYEDSFKKYISELSSTSHTPVPVKPMAHEYTSTPKKIETRVSLAEDDAPLDLSKPLKVSTQSVGEKNREGPTSQSSFSSEQSSGERLAPERERVRQNSGRNSVHSILGSAVDQSYMMNRFNQDQAIHHGGDHDEELSNLSNMSGSPASPSHSQSQSGPGSTGGKRYRTQMTSLQVRIMKQIFQDYKTPTMAECEMLGRVIGLQKRVVQVWFQNARAKEKKAKLNMKSYGSEADFPKPPEECTLCNFKYSHKYTIQDHIFTKKHIDKVREFIQTQSDSEREMSNSVSSMGGVSGLMHTSQSNDVDQMRKIMEEVNSQSQLHSMTGMNFLPPEFLQGSKKESTPKESEKSSRKTEGSSRKENNKMGMADFGHLQGMFGGMMPGMDPGMFPYMYTGLPGFFPGLPSLPPGMMPGADQLLGFDPMTYGTPLPLLQIPAQAIKDVSSKLSEPMAKIGQYTQDCKSISSLRSMVSGVDYSLAQEATVDVGYICKKCHMVYPAKDACIAHQRLMCFPGGKIPEGVNITLKLEQIQYECKLCSEKVSMVQEFKSHCDTEGHKTKLAVYQQQRHGSSGATTPKSSAPSTH